MWGAIEEHRAKLQRNDAQCQLLQHRRTDSCMFPAKAQMRLNKLFPGIQVFFDLVRENLAELRVDAADV